MRRALAGSLSITAFVVFGLIAHSYDSYDSMRGTISALEFTSAARPQRLTFFVFGVLATMFAIVFRELNGGGVRAPPQGDSLDSDAGMGCQDSLRARLACHQPK
jgi:hypothetical protein